MLTGRQDHSYSRSNEDTLLHAEAHDPGRGITKARARTLTKQFAHFLRHEYGIGGGGRADGDDDVVMVVSSGQSALACLFYGVVAAGGVYSAASPMNTPSDLARQLRDGPGRVVVCSRDALEGARTAAAQAGLPGRNVLVLESHPEVRLYSAEEERVRCDFGGELDWERVTDEGQLVKSKICILYSSGTTGLPKGVLVSHLNMVAEIFLTSSRDRQYWDARPAWSRRTLAHLPAAHIAGVVNYFVAQAVSGGTTYWMPKFDFAAFVKYVDELRISTFFTVPPIYLAIAKHPAVKGQFRHARSATVGAAPVSAELRAEANRKMPQLVIGQVWGMSETTGAATYTAVNDEAQAGSLGTLLPNVSVRLVDDDGNDVAPGESGEVLIKGPIVTQGYHKNPEANEKAFTKDGWMRTGDIMRIDANNLYHIVDRKKASSSRWPENTLRSPTSWKLTRTQKELIKYKGLQVAPAELEGILEAHPAVGDAGVIGVPYNDTEAPRAFVVLTPGASISEQSLVDYVHAKVADYKKLRGGLVFVDAVPRSPSGKILRKQLRESEKRMSKM
ncbi:4-coumarate-CoA ligase 2a [Cordyceps fumosorosea ARSEF 2679]|uniref:4-coumarate-CoA ligase 2a n=1 Tax=Cordyceps fumosorosea (strain ARSEF 2679) TaxID=1081104 RepID=A0A168EHC3_CORFA|nr:4-coumarate-CoA ligase 2a [Cordyceps fumosorosea ARSEF 2679]OAA73807.1 4-coumarate-CoA ligase 2a [Cordyceps fumosorosea ARSEF 2679]